MSETQEKSSILQTVKDSLGIQSEIDHFDQELINHINMSIGDLSITGFGPPEGFFVESNETKWESYIQESWPAEMVKTLIFMKVRMIFDPPANSFLVESYHKQIDKMTFLLTVNQEGTYE